MPLSAALSLLPVLGFLALLVGLDSFKLVPVRHVVALIAAGAAAAVLGYVANGALWSWLAIDIAAFSRYVAPVVEEALKGALVLWLIRRRRMGFLVDAAVMGFAIGCGFALAENLHALWRVPEAGAATWLVRGFGTALMHGGATAAFALVALALLARHEEPGAWVFVPGFVLAVLLHSAFNHLSGSPRVAAVAVFFLVPALLLVVFRRGEARVRDWLEHGFDADAQLLQLIHSGDLPDSPVGRYLGELRTRFDGPVVADLLCYLRVFTELALRAKGRLMMREAGFAPPLDADTRERYEELRYLERSIGPTGLLALVPLLPMRSAALRQLHSIEGEDGSRYRPD